MPVIYVKPQHNTQNGYCNSSAEPYIFPDWNYGLKNTRVGFVRFAHVGVPKGSIINSAKIHLSMSVKTSTNSYSAVITPYVDLRHDSPWLDITRAEWAGRSPWHKPAAAPNATFNWTNPSVVPKRQIVPVDVKTHVEALNALANWSAAGGPMTFLFTFSSVSSEDNIYVHTFGDSFPPMLEIDYTPPASDGRETVVNLQENQSFTRTQNSDAAFSIEPWGFNAWFGAFAQPTYTVYSGATGGPAAPYGGNVLKVTAGNGRAMVHNGLAGGFPEGTWLNFSAQIYVPAGSPEVGITALGGRVSTQRTEGVTGQWVHVSHSVLTHTNGGIWFTIEQYDAVANSVFYVANAQLTEGRVARPPITGYRTMTNATYGFAGGTGQFGFVRAVAPSAVMDRITPKARRKYWLPTWNVANSAGHAQHAYEIKTRRVK